jgi:hypothetical protein
VISRSGDIAPIAVTENHVEYGHTTLNRRILDPLLDALTVDYARALFLEGVAGPMAIQLRPAMATGKSWRSICVPQAARLRGFSEASMNFILS